MKIVWDESKRQANIVKHDGLDFADLTVQFFEVAAIFPAKKGRLQAIGRVEDGTDRILVVIFATLGSEAISIISMRPARQDERNLI